MSKAVVSQQRLNTSGWLKGIPKQKNVTGPIDKNGTEKRLTVFVCLFIIIWPGV